MQTAGHDKVDYHEALGSLGLQSKNSSGRIIISHRFTVVPSNAPQTLFFLFFLNA